MSIKAAAHVITRDAVALGDPEIIVMERDDEGAGFTKVIETIELPVNTGSFQTALTILKEAGWRVYGEGADVEPGYRIVDVERD